MGYVRVTRRGRARVGWWVGWAAAVGGVGLVSIPAALIVGGLVVALSFLLLYEVDERNASEPPTGGPPTL